eukprot:g5786.t1
MISNDVQTALALTLLGAFGTTLGGLLMLVYPRMTYFQLGVMQGVAAGLMLCISMMDLLPEAVGSLGMSQGHIAFYLGSVFFAVIAYFVPEPDLDSMMGSESDDKNHNERDSRREVLFSGLVTALGIALHNFPEGVSVFLATMKSPMTGLNLATAIALHNIPEGIAVALPVYFATKSRWYGFKYAALSGLAEPIAVCVMAVLMLVFDFNFSQRALDFTVAGVGGIMAYISFHELIPLSITHSGKTVATVATFIGMAIMSVNLVALH